MNKERESVGSLFNNYDYQEALNFFKKICVNEWYPTLIWNNDHVKNDRLPKVDLGKFDQRKKFIDMFEKYDMKGVSNFIRIDFSYGELRHDMFIEQPESSIQYSTEKFLFQNNIHFDEKQNSYVPGYIKPYLSKKNKDGVLSNFINHPENIQSFATNVLRILKLSPKGILPVNLLEFDLNRVMTFESFEIAGMILSTERLRSKKSLLLSYIEFYKLKHITNHKDSLSMLLDMFDKDEPTLRFPASPGGIEYIRKTNYYYIYKRFLDMIKYSPEYPIIKQCKNKNIQHQLMNEFFRGKLEKIQAVLENRHPRFKSKFKSSVQSYLKNIKRENPSDKAINSNWDDLNSKPKNQQLGFSYNSRVHNTSSDSTQLNETNSIDTTTTTPQDETISDEYFNELDDLSDLDYDSIFNNATSNSKDATTPQDETFSDEYFNELDNLSDLDYDFIFNNAKLNSKETTAMQDETISNEYFDQYFDNLSDSDYNAILNNAIPKNIKTAR